MQLHRPNSYAHSIGPVRPATTDRLRIMVVDDNRDAANTLGALLTMLGNEVEVFHSPAAALDRATAFHPDLAILDISMPQMSGYELAEHLRAVPGWAHCHFIALTGFGQESFRSCSSSAGFLRHYVKPVEIEALLRLIADIGAGRICIEHDPPYF